MMDLIYFVLASWGMTQILVYGTIFENQREWIMEKSNWLGTLIHCPMCTGFWVGVFFSSDGHYPCELRSFATSSNWL